VVEGEKNTQEGGVELCESFSMIFFLSVQYKLGQNLMLQILTHSLNAAEIQSTQIKDKESEREERHKTIYTGSSYNT